MEYTNSPLVDCVVKSPNHSGLRTHKITRITPHCVVGQLSAESIGGCFDSTNVKASCNYGIGYDGRVCLIVDESNRSWCSSSQDNDQRAITIEVASDKTEPYAFKEAAYEKLVELCIDICRRNGIKKLLWLGTKEATLKYKPEDDEAVLTAHRWFKNKSCPGNWMYAREGELAARVTAALLGGETAKPTTNILPEAPFKVEVIVDDLNYRDKASNKGGVLGQTGKGEFTITEVSNGWGMVKELGGWIYVKNPKYCTIKKEEVIKPIPVDTSFKVRVTADSLRIRRGPGTKFAICGQIRDKGVYTITEEENGWGKLKSGAGWICLSYTRKV